MSRQMKRATGLPLRLQVADYELIETSEDLDALAQELMSEKVLAVDTEADSFYHYFDKTCLVQIATREQIYLVDPLAMGGPAELAPLAPIFASPDIRKIFHAAEYDIFVLKRDCSFEFANLFDTMVCAQLLGYPSVGLAGLAERHFQVNLPKDEQRSDWSKRPLSSKQMSYAASDVLYLVALTEQLSRELDQVKRMSWAQEEFEALTRREWSDRSFDTMGYVRIKGARKLNPKSLSVLKELYLMRDARAREMDRPPFKVIGNRALLEIAEQQPRNLAELSSIKGITDLLVRRMGSEMMNAVKTGCKTEHGPIPKLSSGPRRRMDRPAERRLSALKGWRVTRSSEVSLDPGVLCPNSALESIAWHAPHNAKELGEIEQLKGWFVREFGAEIIEVAMAADPTPPTKQTKKSEQASDPGD